MFLETDNLYFPKAGVDWERVNPGTIRWDEKKLESLLHFAGEQNSSSFLVLHREESWRRKIGMFCQRKAETMKPW